ncbi:hypothetical protein QTQ03_16750 [Micromonospora sp. WMMA1363]|uniref:hypothetical protein n=1 Tax=Micromonospora sp. WMMA1363 TaxID=3053985 RepID=UPI00259D0E19|nr:hypothetical protein [Micromonospora sp. WMMA1363]MDM4721168.1 hypothetical protein [Micromonospora sp. WMMA1363]
MSVKPGQAQVVSSSLVRFASTGGATPAVEGDPSLYPSPNTYRTSGTHFGFTVAAGDLDGGNVVFCFATKTSSAAGTLFANSSFPLRWRAMVIS